MADESWERPSQRVLDQIEEGIQDEAMIRVVIGFVRRRIRLLGFNSRDVIEDQAEQLIQDAISDTALGRRCWRPESVKLSTHLCGVVNDRILKALTRRQSVQEVSLADHHKSLQSRSLEISAADRDLWRKIKEHLAREAEQKGDGEVQLLLMAYEEHCFKRAEIARETGLTVEQVTNAGKRLDRLIDHLPRELRQEAADRLGMKGEQE